MSEYLYVNGVPMCRLTDEPPTVYRAVIEGQSVEISARRIADSPLEPFDE